jgi:hypothetical protein
VIAAREPGVAKSTLLDTGDCTTRQMHLERAAGNLLLEKSGRGADAELISDLIGERL